MADKPAAIITGSGRELPARRVQAAVLRARLAFLPAWTSGAANWRLSTVRARRFIGCGATNSIADTCITCLVVTKRDALQRHLAEQDETLVTANSIPDRPAFRSAAVAACPEAARACRDLFPCRSISHDQLRRTHRRDRCRCQDLHR
jgi:hypothetical protein